VRLNYSAEWTSRADRTLTSTNPSRPPRWWWYDDAEGQRVVVLWEAGSWESLGRAAQCGAHQRGLLARAEVPVKTMKAKP
jgi:hypothetical protein